MSLTGRPMLLSESCFLWDIKWSSSCPSTVGKFKLHNKNDHLNLLAVILTIDNATPTRRALQLFLSAFKEHLNFKMF